MSPPAVQAALAAALAALAWLAWTAAHGFTVGNDSIFYAALAAGFDSGHPFTGTVYWLNAQPGRLQAIWPPLYPALVAGVHALGPTLARSEWVVDGAGYVASVALGLAALRVAAGRLPWAAFLLAAVWPAGLFVAGAGWSEPVLLAALGAHFWLAARSARAGDRDRARTRLLFVQGVAAGLGFLARYAAAPFLVTAVLWGPALEVARPARGGRTRDLRAGALRAALPGLAGVALPVVPWIAAAWIGAGQVGATYLAPGDGLLGALRAAFHALLADGLGLYVAPPAARGTHAAALIGLALAVVIAMPSAAAVLLARRGDRPAGAASAARPLWLLCGLLVADGALYTAFLVVIRARYFFDQIGVRLMLPALFPLLLAAIGVAALLPGRLARTAWLGPACLLALWTAGQASAAAVLHPDLSASMSAAPCRPGPQGDCRLLSWLGEHTDPSTLIVSNAAFPIWFTTGRPVEVVASYPYAPYVTAREVAAWTRRWNEFEPHAEVLLVLDGSGGWLGGVGRLFGPYVAGAWRGSAAAPPVGLGAQPLVAGPEYRVWRLSA